MERLRAIAVFALALFFVTACAQTQEDSDGLSLREVLEGTFDALRELNESLLEAAKSWNETSESFERAVDCAKDGDCPEEEDSDGQEESGDREESSDLEPV